MVRSGGSVRGDDEAGSGERIRARRKAVGITQIELATAVGVSRQTIISMETGDYAPSVYLALKVASALKTIVEDLWATPVDATTVDATTVDATPADVTPRATPVRS